MPKILAIILFSIFWGTVFVSPVHAVEGEITYTGTNTTLNGDDAYAGPFNLGFTFNYYGVNYTQAYININGTVNFAAGDSTYSNGALATSGANTSIFGFWDDLITYGQTPIYYATIGTAPDRKFVTQWTSMYFFGTSIQMGTFQIILYEGSNNIQLQYRDLLGGDRALGNSATIGLKKDGATYKQYSSNTASIVQGQSILYTPNGTTDFTVTSQTPDVGAEVSAGYDLVYLAPDGAPTSPTLVNPSNGITGVTLTPTFEWLPVDSATSYTVLISTVANFSSTVVNATGQTGTSYVLGSALNTGTTYYWRIQSVNAKGSSLSSTRSFTTGSANAAPDAPDDVSSLTLIGGSQLLTATGSTLSATLSDPDADEQIRYRLQIATDNAFTNLVIDYRSPFIAEGPITYTYGENTGTYLVGTAGTVLAADDYYLRIRAEDDAAASSSWYTISNSAFSIIPDTQAPHISSIAAAVNSSTSATITWVTNEAASSIVDYGLVSAYGFLTNEINTSPRVVNHTVQLSSLKPCARYFFRVKSTDANSNQAVSTNQNFSTTGCSTSLITTGAESTVPVTGGTVTLVNDQTTARITIPNNFASQQAAFQLNRLDTSNAPAAPSGQTLAANNLYDLVAVTASDEQLTTFDQPITFTISYGADTESTYNESTLDVYKYTDTGWEKKNCTLDVGSNTITCNLPSFSTYAVFGTQIASSVSSVSSVVTSESQSSNASIAPVCADEKPLHAPDLFQINTTKNSATIFFTPISNTSQFFVSYATDPLAMEHGVLVDLHRDGVQSVTINLLKPNSIYYFKVRGQNGCMPGDWSTILKAGTTKNMYYKYAATKLTTTVNINSSMPSVLSAVTSIEDSYPQKRCLLWWCP